jgi:acetyl esterase/lipase
LTSENDERLQQWLERFPEADANEDGLLTLEEAKAYRYRVRGRRARSDRDRNRAPEKPHPPKTHADLRYGLHERNVLDLWLPEEAGAPVSFVVFIHGGGFVGGNKSKVSPSLVESCLERGIAVASTNYRLATTDPFPAPFHDGARAIQYLRSRAKEFGLDPARVGVFGGSAGGGISMWLGTHDDLADPDSDDPVARESSRVCAVGSIGGQCSYDVRVMREWLGDGILQHPSLPKIYRVESVDEVLEPTKELDALIRECSPITHVTPDDPPILLLYDENARGVHDPVLGRKMQEAMKAVGVEAVFNPPAPGGRDQAIVGFFARHFGMG